MLMVRGLTAAVLAAAASIALAGSAHAATFDVNRFDDAGDPSCPTTCTLRAALSAAQNNGNAQPDQINLQPGTYLVTSPLAANGKTPGNVTITGKGANHTFVQPSA